METNPKWMAFHSHFVGIQLGLEYASVEGIYTSYSFWARLRIIKKYEKSKERLTQTVDTWPYSAGTSIREDNSCDITVILCFSPVFYVVFYYQYWNSAVITGYLSISFKNGFYRLDAKSSR